jgi:hypothetical protein
LPIFVNVQKFGAINVKAPEAYCLLWAAEFVLWA